MYNMNSQARDDLSLWLQCIRPYGGSSQLIDSIRRAYRYTPKHIVVITDGMTDMKPANLHSELLNANDKKQIPIHFILPSQKYKEPGFELLGYKSHQSEVVETTKVLRVINSSTKRVVNFFFRKLQKHFLGHFAFLHHQPRLILH